MRAENMATDPQAEVWKNVLLVSLLVLSVVSSMIARRIPVPQWLHGSDAWKTLLFYAISLFPLLSLASASLYFMSTTAMATYYFIVFIFGVIVSPAAMLLSWRSRKIFAWHTLLLLVNIGATVWYISWLLLYIFLARAV